MVQNSRSVLSRGEDVEVRSALDDLVMVSNRQPYRHSYDTDAGGNFSIDYPVGGLTAGLDPVMQKLDGTWVAWGDGEADYRVTDGDDCVDVPPDDPAYTLQRLRLSEDQVRGYYDGYANQGLWPLCHSAPYEATFDADHWNRYREVNGEFARTVLDHVDGETTVWFQDYHFMLAPREVRSEAPDAFLMHFHHVPWPAPDVFRVCPQRSELLEGLLANDLLGFHVPRYCTQFLECVDRFLDGAIVDRPTGRVEYEDHVTTVEAFPLGVDADEIRRTTAAQDGDFWEEFRQSHGIDPDTRVALGVDRLDYTKGIPQRLEMLERLWETRPDLREELTFVQKGSESRERIAAYQRLQERVEETVERINDRFGTDDWQPVVYTTEMYDRGELYSLYRHSDLALVSPLRDGMNLVAKEYVAAQIGDDGTLLLSPLAGAHEQLGRDALDLDPYDVAAGADAVERALEMDPEERKRRMRSLRRAVHREDMSSWLHDVVVAADRVRRQQRRV